jgi:hypothetical protein
MSGPVGILCHLNLIFVLLYSFLKAFILFRVFKMLEGLLTSGSIFSPGFTLTLWSLENVTFSPKTIPRLDYFFLALKRAAFYLRLSPGT